MLICARGTSTVHPITHNAFKLLKILPILLALNEYGIKDMMNRVMGSKLPLPMVFHRSVDMKKIEWRLARGENPEIPDPYVMFFATFPTPW